MQWLVAELLSHFSVSANKYYGMRSYGWQTLLDKGTGPNCKSYRLLNKSVKIVRGLPIVHTGMKARHLDPLFPDFPVRSIVFDWNFISHDIFRLRCLASMLLGRVS